VILDDDEDHDHGPPALTTEPVPSETAPTPLSSSCPFASEPLAAPPPLPLRVTSSINPEEIFLENTVSPWEAPPLFFSPSFPPQV
jgi:hypothetical protein